MQKTPPGGGRYIAGSPGKLKLRNRDQARARTANQSATRIQAGMLRRTVVVF